MKCLLSKNTTFDWTKFNVFADDHMNVAYTVISVLTEEKILRKKKIILLTSIFSHFPTIFANVLLFLMVVQSPELCGKELKNLQVVCNDTET